RSGVGDAPGSPGLHRKAGTPGGSPGQDRSARLMAARTSLQDYQRELAERLQTAATRRSTSKLGLRVGDDAWLVDLADAGEVLPVPAITPVPLTRPWFKGVTNIRGKLYNVVDFPAFLGGDSVSIGEQARLLL